MAEELINREPFKILKSHALLSDGSLGNRVQDTNLNVELYHVKAGEKIVIKGQTLGFGLLAYALYKSDTIDVQNLVKKGPEIMNAEKYTQIDESIMIPSGVTTLAVSPFMADNPKPLKVYHTDTDPLLKPFQTFKSHALLSDGSLGSRVQDTNLNVELYHVQEGDKIAIKGQTLGYGLLAYALYKSDTIDIPNLVQKGTEIMNAEQYAQIDEIIVIPPGVTTLAVSSFIPNNPKPLKAYASGVSPKPEPQPVGPKIIDVYGKVRTIVGKYVADATQVESKRGKSVDEELDSLDMKVNQRISDSEKKNTEGLNSLESQMTSANANLQNDINGVSAAVDEQKKDIDTFANILKTQPVLAKPFQTLKSHALLSDGSLGSRVQDTNLNVELYHVKEGDKIAIKGQTLGYALLAYALYKSDTIDVQNLVKKGPEIMNAEKYTSINDTIEIPSNVTTLAVSSFIPNNYNQLKAYTFSYESQYSVDGYLYNVGYIDNDIKIVYRYSGDEDIRITIGACGANNLCQIKCQEFIYNTQYALSDINEKAREKINSGSDWIGPYVMTADANGNGKSGFTGGWHGFSGGQDGAATAHTESIIAYIDNKVISKGKEYKGFSAKVVVTNLLNAGNTKQEDGQGRNVLKEIVTYEFRNSKIYVSVIFEALENITITRYYGLQVAGYNEIYDFYTAIKIITTVGKNRDVGAAVSDVVGYMKNGRKVIASLDNKGLGIGNYANRNSRAFASYYGSVSSGKAYYSLISDDKPLKLSTGEKAMWSGSYYFKK